MIRLRELKKKDESTLLTWRNLPEVADFMFTAHKITPEEHRKWFSGIRQDRSKRYWVIEMDSKDVGLVCLYNISEQNRRCYWACYLADPAVRGRGVGSFVEYSILNYVFFTLELNKLCGEILSSNSEVIEQQKKFGFQQEGLLREHVVKGDMILDVVVMAMLRNEWIEKKPLVESSLKAKKII